MKRKSIGILALAFLLLLTACGQPGGTKEPEDAQPAAEKIAYMPEYHSFDLDCERVSAGCALDSGIYLLDRRSRVEFSHSGAVTRVSLDGTPAEIFSADTCMEDEYAAVGPQALCAGGDNTFWLLLDCTAERDSQFTNEILLCRYDSQGAELARLDVTNALQEARLAVSSVASVQLDAEGWLYLYGDGSVHVLDGQQKLQFSLPCETVSYQCCAMLPDGQAAAVVYEAKGPGEPPAYELRTIDREARDWGDVYPIQSDRCYQVFPGGGRYLFFWNSGNAIWGWNEASGAGEAILDSGNSDVSFDSNLLRCFAALEDGRLAAVTWENGRGELAVLTPTDPGELPEKTVLTLACTYLPSNLQWYVTEFNKASRDYRIEVREYLTEEESRDNIAAAAGIQRMVVDITAGNVPDLLFLGELSLKKFAEKGILEDLWPYIDGDSELGRENLMTRVLECAEVDGKLYEIFDGFTIRTVAGAAEVVGDRLSWTLEDLEAALEAMPEGASAYGVFWSPDALLYQLVSANMNRYVDWGTGTCSFDSQEFKDLLEYIGGLEQPADNQTRAIEWAEASVMDREQMLYAGTYGRGLTNFLDIPFFESLFNGPVSFVGHPKPDGTCGSSFYAGPENVPMAMTASCKDKEGAWSFLRELLLPQEGMPRRTDQLLQVSAFPINRQDFEALARLSMAEPEGQFSRMFTDESENPFSIQVTSVTQGEYGQFMELYEAVDSLFAEDAGVIEAVRSEAGAYFSGDIALDEAVRRIQSRVQLYMDEQR